MYKFPKWKKVDLLLGLELMKEDLSVYQRHMLTVDYQ